MTNTLNKIKAFIVPGKGGYHVLVSTRGGQWWWLQADCPDRALGTAKAVLEACLAAEGISVQAARPQGLVELWFGDRIAGDVLEELIPGTWSDGQYIKFDPVTNPTLTILFGLPNRPLGA